VKDDRVYLQHIVECLDAIADYTSEGRGRFLADRKTQKATLRELPELAESTQRLSSELKGRHSDLPWTAIAGFRNVLVHDYLGISLSRVWDITQRDLPALRAAVILMLAETESRGTTG
jgi:uncharacterized protein with HEPN domain